MIDNLRHSAGTRGNWDYLACHGLEGRESEGFQFAGKQHDIGNRKFFVNLILLAQEENVVVNPFLYG